MSEYVITINSTSDLPKEWVWERKIPVVPLNCTIGGNTYRDMYDLSADEFYGMLRAGEMAVTSQPSPQAAIDMLEPILKEGKSLEEVAQWVEENKLKICHFFMVEDLNHLQKGGRISKTAAVLGTMVQIKPIIYLDNEGKLQIIKKERGRKKAMNKIVDMAIDACEGKMPDMVMIPHGNCPKDAEYVAELVRKKMGVTNIMMNDIGTVIGGHTGPGMVAVVCMGVHR